MSPGDSCEWAGAAEPRPHRKHPDEGVLVTIDNDVYNRLGATWWEDDSPLVMLHGSMTTGRMRYFRSVLASLGRLPGDGHRSSALDIGSGGGFLAEEFCRLGFAVTGVDPSAPTPEWLANRLRQLKLPDNRELLVSELSGRGTVQAAT